MDPVHPSSDGSEPARFYPRRWQLLGLSATCALMVVIGYAASTSHLWWLALLGFGMIVGFGAATLVLLARALRPGPTVLVGADGITDRTALAPVGLVRWEDVLLVRKRELGRGMGREQMLEVALADEEAFAARPRSPLRRLVEAARRLLRQPPVTIPGSMVSRPMEVLVEEVRRRRPELQVLELPPRMPKPRLFGRQDPIDRQTPKPPRW